VQTVAAARKSAADLLPSSLRRSHEAPLQTLRRARSDAPYHGICKATPLGQPRHVDRHITTFGCTDAVARNPHPARFL